MSKLIIVAFLVFVPVACVHRDAEDHSLDQEDEHVEQLTLFTDSSEIYVEYPGLEMGREAEFLVHITRLSDYKPRTEGRVSITLDFGGMLSSGTADEPMSPGIWRVPVNPGHTDSCLMIFEYFGHNAAERCEFKCVPASGLSADPEYPEGIRFTKEQAWKSDFAVAQVLPGPFQGIIKAGGEILAMPGEKHYIHASTSGIVNYLKRNLVAGVEVARGEDIISIEGKGLARDNIAVDYAESEYRFEQSRSEYARHLSLFKGNAISEKEFIASRSAYLSDSIRYHTLMKSYEDGGLKITSPISGHIHELMVSQGEFVVGGQLIATVSSDRRLLLRADVPQQFYERIDEIVSANFRTSYQESAWDIKDLEGKLLATGASVKENNQYLPVYFEATNNGQLLEGAYAEFFLKTGMEENCVTVPIQAVLEEQQRYYVWVQLAGETFQKREIRPGETDGFRYRVTSGLHAGERVVTLGAMLLKTTSMSSALPVHSHEH